MDRDFGHSDCGFQHLTEHTVAMRPRSYHFAQRALDIPANVFAHMDATVAQAQARGVYVIDLSKANPDLGAPAFIVKEGQAALTRLENHRYTPFNGKDGFLQAAQGWYRREHSVSLDWKRELIATVGSIDGLSTLTQVLLNPGDTLLVPDPYYPPYVALAAAAGAHFVPLPTSTATHFLPDLDAIADDMWREASVMLINYPNNPTGAVATEEFYEALVAKAQQFNVLLINDFAYAGISADAEASHPLSLLSVPGAREVAIEVVSLSKMYAMAGWRLGFVAAPEQVMAQVRTYHHQMRSFPTGAVQDAGQVALASDQRSVRDISQIYSTRRKILAEGLQAAGWDVFDSRGALFVWARVPNTTNSVDFARSLLEKTGVAVMPGVYFGDAGEGYVRLSLLVAEDQLREAVDRITAVTLS